MELCKHISRQVLEYASKQVCTYASKHLSKYVGIKVCTYARLKYASLKHAGMEVCKYASMQECKNAICYFLSVTCYMLLANGIFLSETCYYLQKLVPFFMMVHIQIGQNYNSTCILCFDYVIHEHPRYVLQVR